MVMEKVIFGELDVVKSQQLFTNPFAKSSSFEKNYTYATDFKQSKILLLRFNKASRPVN